MKATSIKEKRKRYKIQLESQSMLEKVKESLKCSNKNECE